MKTDTKKIFERIDFVLDKAKKLASQAKYQDLSDLLSHDVWRVGTLLRSTIVQLSLPGSVHREAVEQIEDDLLGLTGVLQALRIEYEKGYLQAINEVVAAEFFSDFVERAEYLLEEGHKDAAAVLFGGVFEELLRRLCDRSGIALSAGKRPKGAGVLLDELLQMQVVEKMDSSLAKSIIEVRNAAAHGHYDKYDKSRVEVMSQGLSVLLTKYS
jgi:hypothetical protein